MDSYRLLRPLLFQLPPETSHQLTLKALSLAGRIHPLDQFLADAVRGRLPQHPTTVMGIPFPNPVGVAAGLDKHASAVDGLSALGFGFVELGTVTPLAQPGNPRPRLFRLSTINGVINRNGFNSVGLNQFLSNLARSRHTVRVGINIGKNAATPLEHAEHDYLTALRAVYSVADYIAVNISSPNTPGLRDLQGGDSLENLLAKLKDEQSRLSDNHGYYTPLAVKISPDIDQMDIDRIAESLARYELDAVIATNTTTSRPGVSAQAAQSIEQGGLSGEPLNEMSNRVIARLASALGSALPIIGVGGIMNATDAWEKFTAGASLIQLYTGLIYRGPRLLGDILTDIDQRMSGAQAGSLTELLGR